MLGPHTGTQNAESVSPYSPVNAPVKVTSRSTKRQPSKVATETFIYACENLHNLIGVSQQIHNLQQSPNRLGFQEPKSKKLLTFHPTESSSRIQTDAPNAKGKNTRSDQILLSQIPTKLQKLMGE